MSISDRLDLSDAEEVTLTRVLRLGLVALVGYGVVSGRVAVAVNAAGSLGVTFLPALLRRETGVRMDVGLVLWLTVATTAHAVGILGPYQAVWWYDHVTHALSASIVAGVGYAAVDAIDRARDDVHFPEPYRSLVLFAFVLATAVLWEVLEFGAGRLSRLLGGGEPVLIVFGPEDIVSDIVYSAAGGMVVVIWGRGYFRRLSGKLSQAVFGRTAD